VVWVAEAAILVGATVVVAGFAHGVGRSAERRARLRRMTLRRTVPWAAVGLLVAGAAMFVMLPRPSGAPRRYADYLPDAGTGVGLLPGWVLAALLAGAGLLLLSVWLWLRNDSLPGGRGSRRPLAVAGVAGLLLVVALAMGWITDRSEPGLGWFVYAPLSNEPPVAPGDQLQRTQQAVAATLGLLGLGVLTALAGFQTGRRESTERDHS
jgi:heme/copper-type cytochrome/quinol oxidase subunit 1